MSRNAIVIALFAIGLGSCGSDGNAVQGGTGGVAGTGGSVPNSGPQGSGGATSSGGGPGMGGRSESGGDVGSGGGTGRGGASGSGGTVGTGGTTPGPASSSGGRPGSGGTAGSGGVTATGGEPGSGGASGSTGQPDAGSLRDASPKDVSEDVAQDGPKDAVAQQPDAADTPPAQCPSTTTLKAGDNKATLQFGGRTRSYVVYLPSSVKAGTAVPLIFDFHGHGGNAAQEESSSGWKKKADQAGFIMVYPDGVDTSWNVGSCCGLAMSEKVDDVGFTRAMIEATSKPACIDAKRIYATGMSNGAGFVHRLGCEAADVIAAIAAASADLVTDPCTPVRPIAELSVRGLSDTTVAYAGGNTGSTGWYDPGAKGSLDLWKKIDHCTGTSTTTRQYCEGYTACAAGVEVTLCSLPNTGHDTYNNAVSMSVPDVAWEMFQRQPMP